MHARIIGKGQKGHRRPQVVSQVAPSMNGRGVRIGCNTCQSNQLCETDQ